MPTSWLGTCARFSASVYRIRFDAHRRSDCGGRCPDRAGGGGVTIYLGTDDENGRTSLGGVDLYPDPLRAAASITNRAGHPFEFYRKLGYVVVGVLPDANGFGKPDIFMAKRVSRRG